jgi:CRISPR-associated protein Cas2
MLVVIANNLPMAIRGRMKLWFIELKPNVFVSGLKDKAAKKVIEYLYEYCPSQSGLLILTASKSSPGYVINWLGDINRELIELSGLQLIIEKKLKK